MKSCSETMEAKSVSFSSHLTVFFYDEPMCDIETPCIESTDSLQDPLPSIGDLDLDDYSENFVVDDPNGNGKYEILDTARSNSSIGLVRNDTGARDPEDSSPCLKTEFQTSGKPLHRCNAKKWKTPS
eukprot:scpid90799/ scgid15261/ 